MLLGAGAAADACDDSGRSILHYAFVAPSRIRDRRATSRTKRDPIEVVSDLQTVRGISINVADKWKRTPLHYAAMDGSIVTSKILLQHGGQAHARDCDDNDVFQLALLGAQVRLGS